MVGLDEGVPGVAPDDAVLVESATGLKGPHRGNGGVVETFGVGDDAKTGGGESPMEIANGGALVALPQR